MKIFKLLCFTVWVALVSCQSSISPNQAELNAISFCQAYYNLDFEAAKELATPSSSFYISFMATNTTQQHIDKVKANGPATVMVINSQMDEKEGNATIVCSIRNYLKADFFNATSAVVPEKQDTIHLVKEGGKWLVRMDNPLQSEKQSRD